MQFSETILTLRFVRFWLQLTTNSVIKAVEVLISKLARVWAVYSTSTFNTNWNKRHVTTENICFIMSSVSCMIYFKLGSCDKQRVGGMASPPRLMRRLRYGIQNTQRCKLPKKSVLTHESNDAWFKQFLLITVLLSNQKQKSSLKPLVNVNV